MIIFYKFSFIVFYNYSIVKRLEIFIYFYYTIFLVLLLNFKII
uniref:Uncharacterized protein n=1 Tax=Dipterocladia arabiensis TaxID=2007176 RepID=A0A1Z1M0E5_9FLOR|nr:hypothetical protein [Dipterocladia arabiensis]ARW59332.1 hypothetical protein [Dipterocladia arabiensis]